MQRKLIYPGLFILFLLVVAVASSLWQTGRTPAGAGETVHIVSSYITAQSIEELAHQADTIVVGTVLESSDDRVNIARDTRDPSRPATDVTIWGTIYKIEIEESLKGQAGAALWIVQAEDILLPNRGEDTTAHFSERVEPLAVGARYLFFLTLTEAYPDMPLPKLFHGTAEPYRFRLEDGLATAESPAQAAHRLFPPMQEEALLGQVAATIE